MSSIGIVHIYITYLIYVPISYQFETAGASGKWLYVTGPIKVNQKIAIFGSEIWKPGK
jgi:hypothetical protein